jgi:hypothetical protein
MADAATKRKSDLAEQMRLAEEQEAAAAKALKEAEDAQEE